jgi:hypothetical protein
MTRYALQLHDDAAVPYRFEADGRPLGEIRPHALHAAVLHVDGASYWLAHDEGTELHARGASVLRRFVQRLRFDRSYSLRDEAQVMARAQRRWHWSVRRDRIDFEAGLLRCRVLPRGVFDRGYDVLGPDGPLGSVRVSGLLSQRIELEGLVLAPAQAALLLYAVQDCWVGQSRGE